MAQPPSPPYIPAKYQGGQQSQLDRIVMHGTVSATECGGALNIARYFQDPDYESSCHYVVDPCSEYQCVWDHTIAWHDGTNTNSIGVELCDPVDGPADRWDDEPHTVMLDRAAQLVRQLCLAYDIPMRWLSPAEIRRGERGICGHVDMRDAFPGSTSHYDPGPDFPRGRFMRLVTGHTGGASAQTYEGGELMYAVPLRPEGEHCTASLVVPDRNQRLVIAVGDSGQSEGPDLKVHHIKEKNGDGDNVALHVPNDPTVPVGDPWWWIELDPSTVAVVIEYDLTSTKHMATAGFRRVF